MSANTTGLVIWLGGKPAAGKSTLAAGLSSRLRQAGLNTLWLDGERVRSLIAPDLDFSAADQRAFEMRLMELVRDTSQRHDLVVVSAAAPSSAERVFMRSLLPRFREVAVIAPLALMEARDPKGLYRRVRSGNLSGVPGIDAPYEEPITADLVLSTESKTVAELVEELVVFVRGYLDSERNSHRGAAS